MRLAWMIAGMAALAPGAATAQSCWPVAVQIELRDNSGHRMDYVAMDSIVETRRGGGEPVYVDRPPSTRPRTRDDWMLWRARSGCHLEVGSITFYSGQQAMRLNFDMEINSNVRLGPSAFRIQTPRFQSGTFRLRWDPAEPGGAYDRPELLTSERWQRVPE